MPPSGLENKYWELIRTHGSAHMGYANDTLWAREGKPKTGNWHSAFGTRLRRTAKIQTKDPSTPVSRAGESAREPSCAQDAERARGQVTGDREQEKSGDRAIGSSGEVKASGSANAVCFRPVSSLGVDTESFAGRRPRGDSR